MPACCFPCPQVAQAPSCPKGLQRKNIPSSPLSKRSVSISESRTDQRQNAPLGPQRRVTTVLNLPSYWPLQSCRKCCWAGRGARKCVRWDGQPKRKVPSESPNSEGLVYSTDGLPQTLGDQRSSQYSPSRPWGRDQILLWTVLVQTQWIPSSRSVSSTVPVPIPFLQRTAAADAPALPPTTGPCCQHIT